MHQALFGHLLMTNASVTALNVLSNVRQLYPYVPLIDAGESIISEVKDSMTLV